MAKTALHEQHGSKDSSGKFKMDAGMVLNILDKYVAELKSGKMTIKGLSEIDLGNGLFARTFVIQE